MKRKVILICTASLAFLLALGIMLYPLISNAYNEKHYAYLMEDYSQQIAQAEDTELIDARALADAYNRSLQPGVQTADPFSQEAFLAASNEYDALLNMNGSGIMGYIEIPSIDVHLPIYHGTDDATLQKGVGHLLGSSLPVGGDSTHTILTGHSGMASQRMFTDIPLLSEGDTFYLHVYGETLAYQVFFKDEVYPYETQLLQIQEGRDLCTLVTCTPIGVNTYRLLVMAERIPYEEAEVTEETKPEVSADSAWSQNYMKGIIVGFSAVVAITLIAAAGRLIWRKHYEKR